MDHLDRLRSIACLAHTLPGITLVATTQTAGRFVIGRNRLDALMSPCQLRAALVAPIRPGVPSIHDTIVRCDVIGGAIDLGGGLYQPTHPGSTGERWFTTVLPFEVVIDAAERCPLDVPDDALDVVVTPDPDLGTCAVRISATHPRPVPQIDEAAFWLLAACAVDELVSWATSEIRG